LGDREDEASILTELGNVYEALDQLQSAIGCYGLALQIDRELGIRDKEAQHLRQLGAAHRKLGNEPQQAVQCYEQALEIVREIGDLRHEAALLALISYPIAELRGHQAAIATAEAALQLLEQIGDPDLDFVELREELEVWRSGGGVEVAQ
jgi:tetratricopeptide (TPR) repeat protein